MYYYNFGFDPTYILIIIGFLITLIAQIFVSNSYRKYKDIKTRSNLQGFEVARKILDQNNLHDVMVVETKGELSDHYDPTRKVVRLSTDIYHGTSIASASVAAHECGHAIQDKEGYLFLRFRSFIFPLVNISTKIGYFAILIGFIFSSFNLVWIGIFAELIILLFQLITLPVEFNASKRAEVFLNKEALITKEEQTGSKKMLRAAAFTYVASLISTIFEVLRLILIVSGRDD